MVCYHCPISIFDQVIDYLGDNLQAFGISEKNYNTYNHNSALNNDYHKQKVLESINKIIINNIDKFEKYKFFEEQHIFNNIGKNRNSILNLYDTNVNGDFELGLFELNRINNSVVTKRLSIQDNNKYKEYETIEINN